MVAKAMLSYKELQNKPRILQSLTGLSRSEFAQLLVSFERAWQDYLTQHYKKRDNRLRRYGGGRKAELLETQDKLLFILFYFRQYPTQAVQGYLFGIGQAQAHEWIHRLTGVLNQALGYEQLLPERRAYRLKQVLAACPGLEFVVDGTERRIARSQDKAKRDEH
ncbi:helix-turn-helix domain-containing protein [Pseudanabaena sp. PCC 6802]|uniref:helix-turn-helix domain-containing protein n=1 Tax=Pseudanabaena sp. PCC 6802 TaxID=118173 RepID=UPI000346AF26|nr:transposase family protein [Pseudanabaena sp. PCC 6802]